MYILRHPVNSDSREDIFWQSHFFTHSLPTCVDLNQIRVIKICIVACVSSMCYMVMWDWCNSLFYFSDRGILRDGNGPHGYSDHGAWSFSSWERYWLSLALDRPTSIRLGWTKLQYMLLFVDNVLHCLSFELPVHIFASSSAVSSSLTCLWSSLCFSSCKIVWLCFGSLLGFLDIFHYGLFLIYFIF